MEEIKTTEVMEQVVEETTKVEETPEKIVKVKHKEKKPNAIVETVKGAAKSITPDKVIKGLLWFGAGVFTGVTGVKVFGGAKKPAATDEPIEVNFEDPDVNEEN